MVRIYFKGLNELRAIGALMVLFHHLELYKHRQNTTSLYDADLTAFIGKLGRHGVYVFFVLSGFLITYLLLAEKNKNTKIDLKKFYVRRILRIWPLYYFIVFLAFAVLPFVALHCEALQDEIVYYDGIQKMLASPWLVLSLFLLFLPNLALKIRPPVSGASQAWSVGVEEQFYIIWPQLIQRLKQQYLPFAFAFIALLPVWAILCGLFSEKAQNMVQSIINILPINLMATGGFGAYFWYYHRKKIQPFLNSSLLFALNTALLIALLFFPMGNFVFGWVMMVELLFIIQEHFRFNLRNRWLDKIGTISYGVYMYHPIMMYFGYAFIHSVLQPQQSGIIYNLLIYLIVPSLTLVVSHVSYQYFEKRFIAYKNKKFTVLQSGKPDQAA